MANVLGDIILNDGLMKSLHARNVVVLVLNKELPTASHRSYRDRAVTLAFSYIN